MIFRGVRAAWIWFVSTVVTRKSQRRPRGLTASHYSWRTANWSLKISPSLFVYMGINLVSCTGGKKTKRKTSPSLHVMKPKSSKLLWTLQMSATALLRWPLNTPQEAGLECSSASSPEPEQDPEAFLSLNIMLSSADIMISRMGQERSGTLQNNKILG